MNQTLQSLPIAPARPAPRFEIPSAGWDAIRGTESANAPVWDEAAKREAVFRKLVAEYGNSLQYFVLKRVRHADEAKDIAQRAFVEAACSYSEFRGEAELSTWLFGIALNLARNHVNRSPSRRHVFEPETELDNCASEEVDPSTRAGLRQSLRLATLALEALPADMAAALRLVAIEELSYEQAAQELAVPVGTVRSRVSRARALVRAYFERANAVVEF